MSSPLIDRCRDLGRINQMGIYMESREVCFIPVHQERAGIILGHRHITMKRISDKFKCTIKFHPRDVIYNPNNQTPQTYFKYPVFIVKAKNETNLWDAINYIQYVVSFAEVSCLKNKYFTPECYCDDDNDNDTFEFCRPCNELHRRISNEQKL